jgi:beta-1,4-N-acetylglucosaminyltransferase
MIFVSVGTTYAFDPLIRKIDEIAPLLGEEVIVQIGRSNYIPKHCKHFMFKPNLRSYMKRASLVIAHGGAGTSYEILSLGTKLLSVENPDVNDKHQSDLLRELERLGYIVWCKDLSNLHHDILVAKKRRLKKYKAPNCDIHKVINRFLGDLE